MIVEGIILSGRGFDPVEGRLVVEDGRIEAIEEESVAADDLVFPAFVNAHTHIGDSIAKDAGEGLSLTELVAPPDGLKHRLLRNADRADLVAAMEQSARFMESTGTAAFLDFREGGVDGIDRLREATDGLDIVSMALGRESVDAIHRGDGFGAPSARDGTFEREREATREAGKLFGIHAGERDAGDIAGAFDLDPDFLVHMVHPDPGSLDRLEEQGPPVVVCPRSNLVTDVSLPPVRELLDRTTVALGTDNVMLNSPSMFREMEFVAKLTDVSAHEALAMATTAGAEIAGLNAGVIAPGRDAKLVVLDGTSDNLANVQSPVRAIVRRAGSTDVKAVHLADSDAANS